MRPASVGFQCPSCVKEGSRSTRSGRTAYGGRRPGNAAITSQVLIGLNVLVFLYFWNATKFASMAVLSLPMLVGRALFRAIEVRAAQMALRS